MIILYSCLSKTTTKQLMCLIQINCVFQWCILYYNMYIECFVYYIVSWLFVHSFATQTIQSTYRRFVCTSTKSANWKTLNDKDLSKGKTENKFIRARCSSDKQKFYWITQTWRISQRVSPLSNCDWCSPRWKRGQPQPQPSTSAFTSSSFPHPSPAYKSID